MICRLILLRATLLHCQEPAFHPQAVGRRVPAQGTASGEDAMAWHDQRITILGHYRANGSSRASCATFGRQVAVRSGLAPMYPPASCNNTAAEWRDMVKRQRHFREIDRFALGKALQTVD